MGGLAQEDHDVNLNKFLEAACKHKPTFNESK